MCPYYLSMGMTYEQYWDASPYLVSAYEKAYKLKKQQINEQLWLQGMYIYEAFSVVMGNAFAKKGAKKLNYSAQPYEIFEKTEQEKQHEAEKEREKAINSFNALKARMSTEKKGNNDGSNS